MISGSNWRAIVGSHHPDEAVAGKAPAQLIGQTGNVIRHFHVRVDVGHFRIADDKIDKAAVGSYIL